MSPAPVIACVKWGERYGTYYANALYDMVRRHLPPECDYQFQCFTDDPAGLHSSIAVRELPGNLTGWWNKLYLFKEGVFEPEQRVIFFDLDTLITGGLEALLDYKGDFALLRDFYRPHGFGSGVMLWRADACHAIWSRFEEAGRPQPAGGDQAWIETTWPGADRLQDCFPGTFVSFKTDCHPLPPEGACVVCFHGEPKQDNCDAVWVRELWKVGSDYDVLSASLTVEEEKRAFIGDALSKAYPQIEPLPAHDSTAILVGGGPSLNECMEELLEDQRQGGDVFAINGATRWLSTHGIRYDAHVMGNALEEHGALVPSETVPFYYSPACHPAVLKKAEGRLKLWPVNEAENGESTGLQAIRIAHLSGYRRFHLYGFDSCYTGNVHHAYGQPEEERYRRFTAETRGRHFLASSWMLRQADEFLRLADRLLQEGCFFCIHGDGLIHFLATRAVLAQR